MGNHISLTKHANDVAMLTIDRPEVANALSLSLLEEMNNVLDQLDNDKQLKCLIVTGAGTKAFCAGADLKERMNMTDEQVVETVQFIGRTANKLAGMRIPTIAAINGAAFGGGLEFALACDIRIMSQHAKAGLTETSLAIIPGAGGTQRLSRLIGIGQAKRLIFTASPVDAKEAAAIGLAELIAEPEQLIDTALNIADKISKNGPIALQMAKKALDTGIELSLDEGLRIEHECYKQTIHTKDRMEGLKAFKEKRKPVYKGE